LHNEANILKLAHQFKGSLTAIFRMKSLRLNLRRLFYLAAGGTSAVTAFYAYKNIIGNELHIYPQEAQTNLREALLAENQFRDGDAERAYHSALEKTIIDSGTNSWPTASILLKMAEFYQYRGQNEKASALLQSVLQTESLRKDPERLLQVRKALADSLIDLEKYVEAEELLSKCLRDPKLRDREQDTGPFYESLAELRFRQRRFDEAAYDYEKAASILEKDAQNQKQYVTMLNNAVACLVMVENQSRSHELAMKAINAIEKMGSKDEQIKKLKVQLLEILNSRT